MSSWTPRTTKTELEYGGNAHDYYWNNSYNPGASFDLCLANCTTYAYGRILEAGDPGPITGWHNANAWHAYLTNGWIYAAYDIDLVQVGDILEFSGNHVQVVEAIINGVPYVSESYYTGDDGTANTNRSTSVMGSTMLGVSNWMISNYPDRFFHYGPYTDAGMGVPTYVLKNPASHADTDFRFFARVKNKRRVIRYV